MGILSEGLIKKECALSSSFSRGRRIFQGDKVYDLKLTKVSETSVSFEALVEGSYSNSYGVSIELENKQDGAQLKDYDCTCPAFAGYSGFCKHLVALALEINFEYNIEEVSQFIKDEKIGSVFEKEYEYDEEYEDEDGSEEFFSKPSVGSYLGQSSITTASGKTFGADQRGKTIVERSSQQLLDAISAMVLNERNQFCQETAGGEVDFEVTLNLASDAEYLSLRIGKKQMYVVKNIEELVENIRNQNFVRYGKKLEFVHVQSAFCKEALPLVSFLMNVSFSSVYRYYYYDSYQRDKRYLQLDEKMLDDVFALLEGKELELISPFSYEKSMVHVRREDPVLPVSIKGSENKNKAVISFPEIILLEGIEHFYIYRKGRDVIYICSEQYGQDMKEILKLMAMNQTRAERKQSYYYSYMKNQQTLNLSQRDYISFTTTLLPILEKYTNLSVTDIDFTEYQMEEGQYELYFDLVDERNVVCKAEAIYGERKHNLVKTAALNESYRDIKTEYEIRTLLNSYLPERTDDGKQFLLRQDDDRLAALVEDGINQLKNLADVYASEEFKKVRIANPVQVATGLSIKGNLLNVSWNVEGMSTDELMDILGAYRRKKKYHRLINGELLNLTDSGLDVLADIEESLNISKTQLKAGMVNVPLYRALYLDALMKENAGRIRSERNEAFERLIDNFEQLKNKNYELPNLLTVELRSYQMEGYQWACMLTEFGFGGILADDMGLGKTVQMIACLCHAEGMTHLVVCPASLVYNWEAEFHNFAPACKICLIIGNAAERSSLLEHYLDYDVLVTSYDLLKRDIDLYEGKQFGCQVIDEAQYIKNTT